MNKMKMITKSCLILLACILIGSVLITAANYIPVNEENKNSSMEAIENEGGFPEVPSLKGEEGEFLSMNPTALELATDSLMLRMALHEGDGEGIIQAFQCYSTQAGYETEYSRYWHGYVVVLRTLLFVFDYYEIRILNSLFQGIIVALIAFQLWKEKGIKYALAIGTSYLLLMPMALGMCLQYSWAFYGAFIPLLIYVYNRKFWETGNRYIYYFIVVGVVINYLDLLTYPLLSWGLLITWWLILQDKKETTFEYLKKVVFSGFAWIFGYGGMWVGKWAAGSIVLRQNLFRKAISEALLWTVEEGENVITLKDRLGALVINWGVYNYKIYMIILIAWLLYWMVHGMLCGGNKNVKAPALLLVASSGFVWHLLLAGHSFMHHIFTHRTFGVSIAAFLGLIILSTERKTICAKGVRYWVSRIVGIGGVCVLGAVMMFQVKEEFSHHNGGSSFVTVDLNDSAYMTFTPVYSEINKLTVGFSVTDGNSGYCQIQVLDEELVAEELMIPISENLAGNFHEIEVDWKLQAGHPYTLVIEPVEIEGDIQLWITENGDMPLSEYGEVTVEEGGLSGQILAGVSYKRILTDNSERLGYTVAFTGLLMMIIYSCWSVMRVNSKNK